MDAEEPRSPEGVGSSRWVAVTRPVRWFRDRARTLARSPELRLLRWTLLVGFVVRLVLAPLTSWGVDTPSFVLSALSLVYTGSPYSSNLFFNPPLGPFVEAPFFALVVWFASPQSLVPSISAIAPAAAATGMASELVPTAAALLALKLPLLLADVGSTLALFVLIRAQRGTQAAQRAAAVWFLNPLVVWSSAVHGEVDGLAVFFVLLFLWGAVQRRPFLAGAGLALAIFTKPFPLVLLPLGVAVFAFARPDDGTTVRARLHRVAGFVAGALAASAPFLIFLPAMLAQLVTSSNNELLGGMSPLILFNGGVPKLPGAWGAWETRATAGWVLDAFRWLAVVAILGSVLLVYLYARRARIRSPSDTTSLLALAALWATVGVLLSDSVPQSENMVLPLALLLVAAPLLGKYARSAYLLLSAAAFGLYMALLTPLAYFYPLASWIGLPAVQYVNGISIAYAHTQGLVSQTGAWLVCGLIGGGVLLGLWGLATHRLLVHSGLRGLFHREPGSPAGEG